MEDGAAAFERGVERAGDEEVAAGHDLHARQLLEVLDGVESAPRRGVAEARADGVAMVDEVAHEVAARVAARARDGDGAVGGADRGHDCGLELHAGAGVPQARARGAQLRADSARRSETGV